MYMNRIIGLILILVNPVLLYGQLDDENHIFRFAFLTDIHLNNGHLNKEHGGFQGIVKAINNAKSQNVDFILTGGDNVDIDGLKRQDTETAHLLYQTYSKIIDESQIPFYATIGNHDRFWACDKEDTLYNDGLFEKYLNKSYYSFEHKSWHFIVLNTVQMCDGKYCVDDVQKEWLKNDLGRLDTTIPIVVSVHVPFLSVYYPALEGIYKSQDTFSNFREIWDMFEGYNLKLVLQGHQHLYEEINVLGVQFITAGAVSAKWWNGSYYGTQEGYLLVECNDAEYSWKYIDYGWDDSE